MTGSGPGLAFDGFILLRPLWLLALLPVAAWLRHTSRNPVRNASGWETVVDAHLLPILTTTPHKARRSALPGAVIVLALIALSGPALPGKTATTFRTDATRVLIADLSSSAPEDASARLRVEVLDLLRAMPAGQTAVIAYAEEPWLIAPPTTDTATLALLAPELSQAAMPAPGDRPDRALRLGADILARSGAAARDIVWLRASPARAEIAPSSAAALREAGIRLSVLQIGPAALPAPAPIRTEIAASGGLWLDAATDDSDIRRLVSLLDVEIGAASEGTRRTGTPRDLGPWILAFAALLAAIALRAGPLLAVTVALLLPPADANAFDFSLWRPSSHKDALSSLQRGDYDKAAAQFTDARWRALADYRAGRFQAAAEALAPFNDADSLYNRGTALARIDRLAEALTALEAAHALQPKDPDIRHNRDLVRALLDAKGNPPSGKGTPPEPPPATRDSTAQDSPAPPPPPSDARNAPSPPERRPTEDDARREASLLADQWLRRVPDEPAGLLRRKLQLEDARRRSGEADKPWE